VPRLIIQRAVEDEFDAWLGRARYERRPDYQRGLRNFDSGLRNGYRPRRVQTEDGELKVEIPQGLCNSQARKRACPARDRRRPFMGSGHSRRQAWVGFAPCQDRQAYCRLAGD
jgi:transposase-like protein